MNGVAATPTLNFSVVSTTPAPAGPTSSVLGPSSSGTLAWNSNGSLAQLAGLDGFNSASAQNFGNSQTCAYTHDDLGRLSTVDCGAGKWGQNFTYGSDNFGNINWTTPNGHVGSSFLFGYDPGTNHYTGGPQYDPNGNLLSDVAHTYVWDAAGNLYQIDAGAAMVYDAFDRRIEQPNGSVILYGPDGSKLALMSGQTVTRAFVPLPGGATAVYQGAGLAWYRHSDWLGSSRLASTPTSRTVYYDGAYSPFGETIGETGTADRNFTGQNQDLGATDEYDFLYRQYHATQGRWIQPDPGGTASVDPTNPQTWNRYAYVHNSPLANVDPDGQGIFGDILGVVGMFFGIPFPVGWVIGEDVDLALGAEPGPPPVLGGSSLGGGLSLGGLTQCGGPFGNCGTLGADPWSELSGLGNVQDPGRFVNDLQGIERMRCAALGSDSWSLNVGLSKALGWAGYNPDKFPNSALFGSSTATISSLITGPARGYSAAQLAVNSPVKANMVNVATGAIGKVPVAGMGTVQLAADSGGRVYGKAWAGATLGGKGAFKAISKALGVASMIGLAWDVGTYGGAYYLCGQIK